ncbi:MAG: 4Fe-4S binding protein, partial [Armatimonadetes bacterium]|nr:4Fe-4S binding protein [Armatimonadota bacterium]
MSIRVDPEKCNGCGLCVKSCPVNVIRIVPVSESLVEESIAGSERPRKNKKGLASIAVEGCTMCGACVEACRLDAISIDTPSETRWELDRAAGDFNKYRGVWVFGEQRDGKIAPVVFELIGVGRSLADARGTELAVVILGHNLSEAVEELASYPVDKVYVYEAPELAVYDAERYCRVLSDVTRELKPEIFLAGATTTGRSFMSGVAINLYTGLTA